MSAEPKEPGVSAGCEPVEAGMDAARNFFDELSKTEGVAFTDDADLDALGDRFLGFLEKTRSVAIGRATADWLVDQVEVDDLFADDATIEHVMRGCFSR